MIMSKGFWRGWLACAAFLMAAQDWYGKEAFLRQAAERWVTLPWWVGGALFALAVCLDAYRKDS